MTLPSTQEETPVKAIQELLSQADNSVWSTETPEVYLWEERSQDERGPGQGMPPELYVSQLTGGPIERISADGVLFRETPTCEIWVYSLDDTETAQLARDVISYMSEFMDNQEANSPFVDMQPSNVEDYREQKLRKVTQHYIYEVEIEMEKLTDTGV